MEDEFIEVEDIDESDEDKKEEIGDEIPDIPLSLET